MVLAVLSVCGYGNLPSYMSVAIYHLARYIYTGSVICLWLSLAAINPTIFKYLFVLQLYWQCCLPVGMAICHCSRQIVLAVLSVCGYGYSPFNPLYCLAVLSVCGYGYSPFNPLYCLAVLSVCGYGYSPFNPLYCLAVLSVCGYGYSPFNPLYCLAVLSVCGYGYSPFIPLYCTGSVICLWVWLFAIYSTVLYWQCYLSGGASCHLFHYILNIYF